MPTLKSSRKRLRQNVKRRARNRAEKSRMRTVVKRALAAIDDDPTTAEEALAAAYGALDRAAKKGVIHTRQADRRKARLAARLKTAKQGKE
ncbi:MAG: 30S ribosomal protein S20 [Candidatus Coatesbacteria bacterium]|nr:MAG: 30S ribosomal protein S20 [Candidatus Coatesbacteria bacterium]